jgi:hypothetical protein
MGRVAWSCLFVFAVAVAPLVAPARGLVAETALYPVTVASPPPPAPPPHVMSAPAPRPPFIPPAPPSLPLVGVALPDVPVPAVPMLETLPVTSALSLQGLFAVHDTPSRLTVRENAPPRPRPAALVPMYASFATLQALDYHSTTRAISQGIGREANPLARSVVEHPAGFLALKAGATAGMIWASERMRKKHPGRAVVLMLASNATMAVIVAHNYSIR